MQMAADSNKKKDFHFLSILTNIQPFLFCRGFSNYFKVLTFMLKSVFIYCSSRCLKNCIRPLSTSQAQNNMEKFALSKKYHGLEKNVWVEFVKLALEYKPLNLGQGLPDDLVPEYVLQSLAGKYTYDFVFPVLKRHNRDCHIQRK